MRIRATIAIALAAAGFTAIACGGSGGTADSNEAGHASAAQTLASSAAAKPSARSAGASAKPDSTAHPARHRARRSVKAAAAPAIASATTARKSAVSRAKAGASPSPEGHASGQGRKQGKGSGSASAGNGQGEKKKGHKGLPYVAPPAPAGNIPLPGGVSVFDVAKGMCSDPRVLQYLPQDQRDDPEALATLAENYAPPGHEQEAHDGCLAGLKSQGL
jgi:hypothetical protein